MKNNMLKWLQNWFFQNCDGQWETRERFFLRTIDNPGWGISLYLQDSVYENKLFNKIIIDRTTQDWCHCLIRNKELMAAGGPFNLNETLHYFRNWIEDTKETNIIENDIINWLQNWFYQYCDGDWEHSGIVHIKTTSTSNWFVSILIEGTHCENKTFQPIRVKHSEQNWHRSFLKENRFEGKGGPFNLIDILTTFREWAEKCQEENK